MVRSIAFAVLSARALLPTYNAYRAFKALSVLTISIPAGMALKNVELIGLAAISVNALSISAIARLNPASLVINPTLTPLPSGT
ncbi:hypothetical protein D3C79_1032720 [compost metagenome]